LALAALVLVLGDASAQIASQDSTERVIRRLEAAEANGLLRRDSTLLRTIWSPDFTVNNPRNSITHGSDEVIALIRNGTIDYASVVREIETVLVEGNTVIVMGAESISPVRGAPYAGQTIRRRFTHFWKLQDGIWRLRARHANVVCPA
jgi:ketosteroid isomerase-like protein